MNSNDPAEDVNLLNGDRSISRRTSAHSFFYGELGLKLKPPFFEVDQRCPDARRL